MMVICYHTCHKFYRLERCALRKEICEFVCIVQCLILVIKLILKIMVAQQQKYSDTERFQHLVRKKFLKSIFLFFQVSLSRSEVERKIATWTGECRAA